jgi:lysophospholipase L1-like esterase
MKTVLCFGDSVTWGFNPADGTRYGFNERWPGILELEMNGQVRVIEEALPGRTINTDSPFLQGRNGAEVLDMILETHSPIDIFIMMLGTNDLWNGFNYSPSYITTACLSLVWKVQKSHSGPEFGSPQILLISPPPLGKLSAYMELFFKGREKVSRELAGLYRTGAKTSGMKFLDSSKYVKTSTVDGVHLEPGEHKKLARAVKKAIATMF